MSRSIDFLLIGGGLASVTAAKTLRTEGDGSILLLSAETSPPYHRPPLSKRFLSGKQAAERLLIQPPAFYTGQSIELALGTRAVSVVPGQHVVRTDRGDEIQYRKLLIATGGSANQIQAPGAALEGVFPLRTLADAANIRAAAGAAKRAVVIGGSFLGLEVAATLTEMGLGVVLLEREASLMTKLNAPQISEFLAKRCAERGMTVVLGTGPAAIEGDTQVQAVVAETGERFPCDMVVGAIGITPDVGFLAGSGLAVDDGVVVDERLQASAPDIFAAGDVANFFDPVFGRRRRLEHWDNAVKQGQLAARNMLGRNLPYDELSYFYSDVFDVSFDVLGAVEEGDERIARGALERRSFALFYLKNDVGRGMFALGRPADEIRSAEGLIRHRTNLAAVKGRLGDEAFTLRDVPAQTVLILQGGGALGAFEYGVVRALEEAQLHPDIVAGVSIGAINGAIIASHPRHATAALEAFWNDLAVTALDLYQRDLTRAAALWQILTMGVPRFFTPRWLNGIDWLAALASGCTSLYDTTPMRALIANYVDFTRLKSSPVRLLLSAVNVETAQLEIFDSYVDDLTPDHILASGSLPPGFPWTTIGAKHYWDGGIISNSPLDLVIDRCGPTNKRVFIVDLFAGRKPLPTNLLEVLARRDEILFAERIRNDLRTEELVRGFRGLVEELLGELGAEAAKRMKSRPHYIQLMGDVAPMAVTRIVREGEVGEPSSRDYDFSREALARNGAEGYRLANEALGRARKRA